ncbi:MAG: helix-turn-helix domain-containing protein [Bacteroidota bacterium]
MKYKRNTKEAIYKALEEYKRGKTAKEIAQELKIDQSTFYYWRKKYLR